MAGRWLTVAIGAATALSACGDTAPAVTAPVEIVEVIDDVAYYPACSNETVEVDGTTWYPVPEWGSDDLAELHAAITAVERRQPVAIRGFAPRVAEPGPGDDVGTMVIWADGVARYESDSGLVQWLTTDEQTYDWVC